MAQREYKGTREWSLEHVVTGESMGRGLCHLELMTHLLTRCQTSPSDSSVTFDIGSEDIKWVTLTGVTLPSDSVTTIVEGRARPRRGKCNYSNNLYNL